MITIDSPGECVCFVDTETGERCYIDSGVGYDINVAATAAAARRGKWIQGYQEESAAFAEVNGMTRSQWEKWIDKRTDVTHDQLEWVAPSA